MLENNTTLKITRACTLWCKRLTPPCSLANDHAGRLYKYLDRLKNKNKKLDSYRPSSEFGGR